MNGGLKFAEKWRATTTTTNNQQQRTTHNTVVKKTKNGLAVPVAVAVVGLLLVVRLSGLVALVAELWA
jgi:hypothetical protein